jgi:hypothetical protein
MFRSELEKPDENIFIETINLHYEALDKRRTLYRLKYNPHFKEEYEHVGNDRFNVPLDDLEIIWQLQEHSPNDLPELPLLYDSEIVPSDNKDWQSKYQQLITVFEKLLVEQFAISELRDIWRRKAGYYVPSQNKEEDDIHEGPIYS